MPLNRYLIENHNETLYRYRKSVTVSFIQNILFKKNFFLVFRIIFLVNIMIQVESVAYQQEQ